MQTAVRGVEDAPCRAFSSRCPCSSTSPAVFSPPSLSSPSPSPSPLVFFTSSLHCLTFLSVEGGDNDNDSDGGNSSDDVNDSDTDKDNDKDKDNVAAHLLTKIAEQVDKVADKDEADGGDVEEDRSVVLAVPNLAVLPDHKNANIVTKERVLKRITT